MFVQNFYDIDIRVRRKAEALVSAGYSVDVLALRGKNSPATYTLEGVNVRTIALGKQRGSLVRYAFEYIWFLLWCMYRVTVQMRTRRYALVDVNTLPDFLVFASLIVRYMGAKVVLDMHEITPEFYMSKYGIAPNSLIVRLLQFQERISFQFADHVLAINEPILDLLCSRGLDRSRTTIIMNSADERPFHQHSKKLKTEIAPPDPATFVMMYHGTLTRLYGLDIAIEAFALVHEEMPGAEIWILGSGPEKETLQRLIHEHSLSSKVKLVGQVPTSDIPGWLTRCEVGLLPIRRDVFLDYASPNKLPEFIVMRKPVIISKLRAIEFYYSPQSLAYFDPMDRIDLGRAMLELYCDTPMRSRLVNNALQEYAPICWDVMKERYMQMIDALVHPVRDEKKSLHGAIETASRVQQRD
jgi:glycosyltransferase involved in cell wall biosynthesis